MNKLKELKELWHQRPWYENAASIVGIPCSLAVIVLAIVQLVGIWEDAAYVYMPLTCIVMLAQTVQNWRKQRGVAIFSLCTAAFILAVAVFILASPL